MSLSCFFGHELSPNGIGFSPILPANSTLVLTQVCVTSSFPSGGPVTLSVQGSKMPTKIAVCTLCPDEGIYHWPVQLIFSGHVTFFLEPFGQASAKKGEDTPGRPHVQISGYYECDELEDQADSEESEEDEFEKKAGAKGSAKKKGGKEDANKKNTKKRDRE